MRDHIYRQPKKFPGRDMQECKMRGTCYTGHPCMPMFNEYLG